jgi:hypothetical protein
MDNDKIATLAIKVGYKEKEWRKKITGLGEDVPYVSLYCKRAFKDEGE